MKVAGQWRYVYRAIDQFGQVVDVLVSPRRDTMAAHRFLRRAIGMTKVAPVEVVTDRAATYPMVLQELLPAAWHRTEQYANNRVEADHGRLKARLRPMRGLKQDHSARVIIAGHGFVQNLRRGHYELAAEEPVNRRDGDRLRRARGHNLIRKCAGLQHAAGWHNATDLARLRAGTVTLTATSALRCAVLCDTGSVERSMPRAWPPRRPRPDG